MNGSNTHYSYFGILVTTYKRVFLINAEESEASLVIIDVARSGK